MPTSAVQSYVVLFSAMQAYAVLCSAIQHCAVLNAGQLWKNLIPKIPAVDKLWWATLGILHFELHSKSNL